MANEAGDFHPFVDEMIKMVDGLRSGTVYFILRSRIVG